VPGHDDLVLVRHIDRLFLVDISSGEAVERVLFPGAFEGVAALAADGGGGLVVGSPEAADAASDPALPPLAYVDVEQGDVAWLEGPEGEPLQFVLAGERWVLLSGADAGAPAGLFALDLETGQLSAVLDLQGDETLLPEFTRASVDGRMLLVVTQVAEDTERGYLVDAQTGDVTELVDADRVRGSVSPAGTWISYTTLNQTDDGRRMSLELLDVATGGVTSFGPGLDPTWLNS
jgi:hypothetical protein